MMTQANRITPAIGAGHYKTYAIDSPVSTHTRPASCAEVDCEHHREGWSTRVQAGDHADFVRAVCRGEADGIRRHAIEQPEADGHVLFIFDAGQPCFRQGEHRVPLDRPALYLVRGGDWRGNPAGIPTVVHSGPDAWVNDFGDHQDRLSRAIEGG